MPDAPAPARGRGHVAYTTGRWRCMVTGCPAHGRWQAAARPSVQAHRHYLAHHWRATP